MSITCTTALEAASAAKQASFTLATLSSEARNEALTLIHAELTASKDEILLANAADVDAAREAAKHGDLSDALVSRLDLNKPGKWDEMMGGILSVRDLEDPVGKVTLHTKLDHGLHLTRVTAPIGLLLIIFEARPEVIANIASLALKSGNAAILKGGKESTRSFLAISTAISRALTKSQVPPAALQLVTTRDAIGPLLALDGLIDLVIPRGGNELVKHIKNNTRIPVLGHADGICALYLASDADPTISHPVLLDSATNYVAACNSLETLLVQSSGLSTVFPPAARMLIDAGVTLKCTARVKQALLTAIPELAESSLIQDAVDEDFKTEFLSLTLAVADVEDEMAAVRHINSHGSGHTEVICTQNEDVAERFMAGVDSAGAYWNASSRFADGMRYGFGTEVGISTNKIHSRGPVGLEGLMIYKYKLRGQGHASSMYGSGEGKRAYLHEKMDL